MRQLVSLVALAVVAAACEVVHVDDVIGPQVTPTSSTMAGAAPTPTSAATTSTTLPPGPPVAWIAPSGVPLAVTATDGSVIEVLTPCGDPLAMTEGQPIYEVDVVIDPGHGGPVDTGAVAPTGLAEQEINRRVGLETQELLEERGIATALTRIGDYPIPIRTRVEYATLMEAEVLVSIHHNAPAAPPSDIPGIEIFVQHDSTESQRLGGLLHESILEELGRFDVDWDRAPDAGVMTVLNTEGSDAYGLVRLPDMPSALVELGYIANRAEAVLYQTPEYVPGAATAVADAIEAFLTTDRDGSPLVAGRIFTPNRGVGRDRCVDVDLERALYPDVIGVEVGGGADSYNFEVTVSSPYDTPQRYADAFRIVGDDGTVYGIRELLHDHASEQPFTRSLGGVQIPEAVHRVTVEARDQVYGWGGASVEVELP
jgi:N-acetylmuramoyl-L-alanine amidase